jgi:diacylglycerol kinase
MKKRIAAFRFAFQGILHGCKTEMHMRIHLLATVVVLGLGIYLNVSAWEWCVLVLCMGVVLAAELLNAAIERLANRITLEHDPLIGQAKDLAAGAVLIASLSALVAGLIIFLPRLWLLCC